MRACSDEEAAVRKQHEAAAHTPCTQLVVASAYANLTAEESIYAHHFCVASWAGARVCLSQVSHESPAIFDLLLGIFRTARTTTSSWPSAMSAVAKAASAVVSPDEYKLFLAYAATFLANMGNYLSFGASKVLPGLPDEAFNRIVEAVPGINADKSFLEAQWSAVRHVMYSLTDDERELNFAPTGRSGYYSPGLTKAEAEVVGAWLHRTGLDPLNTRIFKVLQLEEDSAKPLYEVRVASARQEVADVVDAGSFCVRVCHGDFSKEMAAVAAALQAAGEHVANDTQREMLRHYVNHFTTGDVEQHKLSQAAWVRDTGPVVEANIGFIETYADPLGVRAEFEGFVAIVNKEQSAKFAKLVDTAPQLLSLLPWPPAFEKDNFTRPDFTSLEVLCFASTGVPAGINIPNYNDIRQTIGFKNVSLGNVLVAPQGSEPVTFLPPPMQDLWHKVKPAAWEVQVGCHELLGHGSGKLLQENADGTFNFDRATINPLTDSSGPTRTSPPWPGKPVSSWYCPGQTWDGVFGALSSSFEECRAECTGIVMATVPEALACFGHTDPEECADVTLVVWLLMARSGLVALEMYSPQTRQWRQAHQQARFAILTTLLAASTADPDPSPTPFLVIEEVVGPVGQELVDLQIHLNREKILSVGVPAIRELLAALQLHKATADVAGGTKLYHARTAVEGNWLERQRVVIAKKQPRPLFVQPHTVLDPETGRVWLEEFEASHEGLIQSFLTRYS